MSKKRVTIYDLANQLNISASTVSRALKGHQGIAKKTVLQVRALAKDLGYKPNTLASSLRTKKSRSIGVLVPQIDRTFISTLISGIEEIANQAGYNVIISQSLDKQENEIKNATSLLSSGVDGVISSLAMNTTSFEHFQLFLDHNIPLVMADRTAENMHVDKVEVDNFNAGLKVTEYLISTGCRRIAHLAGSKRRNVYRDRKEGYLAALKKHNLSMDPDLLIYSDLSDESGIVCTQQLLDLPVPPDAIFIANDTAAVSALLHLKKQGFRIPDDIAIVGFNNDPIASIVEPRLTSVDHPAREIGRTAAMRLLERMIIEHQKELQPKTIVLRTKLVIGESSRLIKAPIT